MAEHLATLMSTEMDQYGLRVCQSMWSAAAYGEAARRVHVDAAAEQLAAVGRHEGRNVEHAALHLLEQPTQVLVVERQCALL